MKKVISKNGSIVVLFFILLASLSCKKSAEEITCNLNAPSNTTTESMSVQYKASRTGDGTISQIIYQTNDGEKTVLNPSLPWQVTEDIDPDIEVSISASGKVTNGSLTIAYDGTGASSEIEGSDYCSQNL